MMRKRVYGRSMFNRRPVKKAKTVTAKISKLQRQVALLKPETKWFQIAGDFSNLVNLSENIVHVSPIAQGDEGNNRIGNTVRMLSVRVRIRGVLSLAETSLRLILIKDLQSNGALPDVTGASTSIFTSADPRTAFVSFGVKDRFKVVYDNTWASDALNNSPTTLQDDITIPLNCVTTYNLAGASQTVAAKNQFYIVAMVNSASSTSDAAYGFDFTFSDV